jgi:hypothetical protein
MTCRHDIIVDANPNQKSLELFSSHSNICSSLAGGDAYLADSVDGEGLSGGGGVDLNETLKLSDPSNQNIGQFP